MDIKDKYNIHDIIRYRYEYMCAQYGKHPTRIILGWEIIRMLEETYYNFYPRGFYFDQSNIIYMGTPVTVDRQNGRLISMSIDEDFEV
jgi:hypothetical protein